MAALWSAIKGPSDHQQDGLSQAQPAVAGSTNGGSTRLPPPSRALAAAPQPLPRSPNSGEPRGTSSPASTTSHPAAPPSKKTPSSRLSRSNTVGARKEEQDRDEESDAQNADESAKGASSSILSAFGTSVARATPPPPVPSPASNAAIDPLSQHIFMRTNTDYSIPQRLRHPSRPESPTQQMAEGLAQPSLDYTVKAAAPAGDVVRDKSKKGPSFLSRLGMRGIKKKDAGDLDSDSELGSEARMDGINALVFSQSLAAPFAGAGYTPHHKEPPRYIRTKANNKKTREFNRMFLAQELVGTQPPEPGEGEAPSGLGVSPTVTVSVAGVNGRRVAKTGGAIWATEFSRDGKYFATAGRDHVVRVWAVISTPEERRACEEEEAANGGSGERLSAPVFRGRPVQEFQGHTGEVLDLSWSKNNFLLSSSMDKTVRLWHTSRTECLCTFKHKDFVTRLAFHPRDDRFFLAGSLDTMLRLWSIPDKTIAFSAQLPDLVTAVAFSPDGRTAIAGLLSGLCLFYETEGLKPQSQIHVRSSRGKNAKGSKITSIQAIDVSQPNPVVSPSQAPGSGSASYTSTENPTQGDVRVLITSNDSRIRIYNLRDKTLDMKLKGHDNACSQIAASFSDDGNYVICGSEDRKTFIWSLNGEAAVSQDKDKSPCEYFDAHGEMVTTAVFAPTRTRMLLGQSGDPIYDLCNPPPVVLRSLEEAASTAASQTAQSMDEAPPPAVPETTSRRPEPSAGYIARSTHYDGNIIVTTDDTGIIKVFRQDCAYNKRRHDSWETGSTLSRKLTAHGGMFSSGLGRSGSILTRTSASSAAHSRRGSLSQSVGSGMLASPQLGGASASSDRILSWRQSIEHGSDRRHNAIPHGSGTPTRSERSASPTKASRTPLGSSAANLASDARRQPYGGSSPAATWANSTVTSPTTSFFSNTPEQPPIRLVKDKPRPDTKNRDSAQAPEQESPGLPLPSFTFRPAESDGQFPPDPVGTGNSFWNLSRWRGIAGFKAGASSQGQAGGHARALSSGSLLSRSRNVMDGSSEEKDKDVKDAEREKEREKPDRRQSLGIFGTGSAEAIEPSRRTELPPSPLGQGVSESDARSIPIINVVAGEDGLTRNPVQVPHDGSPYRHLWNRGTSEVSRRSSELSGDIEEVDEEEEEEDGEDGGVDGEEAACRNCGGKEFKLRRISGKQRLSCGRCGMLVD